MKKRGEELKNQEKGKDIMTVNERVDALRVEMKQEGIDAYIISSNDPHQTETPAERYQSRRWISGFTGTAGTVVVTNTTACIWVDYRYYIQAEEESEGTYFKVFRMGLPDVIDMDEWIIQQFDDGGVVGLDGMVFSLSRCRNLINKFTPKGISLRSDIDLIDRLWLDRPDLPDAEVRDHDVKYAGYSREVKLEEIRAVLAELNCDSHLLCKLDDIAWTLNIRGNDMEHQPLATSFLLISQSECVWFINPGKVSATIADKMKSAGVRIEDYGTTSSFLSKLEEGHRILINPSELSYSLFHSIPERCNIIEGKSPVPLMKSCKNDIEVDGAFSACAKDGAAMVRFLIWLEESVGKGGVTELLCADKVAELRSEMDLFQDISFKSIVGYQEHGALCHYSVTEESNVAIKPEGFLLIDSGGHYLDGTTDMTRTIAVGPLTEQQKLDYTLVLKAHINLALTIFPEGTRGGDLEVIGKMALWQAGRDYGHSAGHGIGSYLMVHEGPAGFGRSKATLQEGMILTNEPGLYREGEYGIRIENMLVVSHCDDTDFGTFFEFETIGMCPIDLTPLLPEMLTDEEAEWLNFYHADVRAVLKPLLSDEEFKWLEAVTEPV